MVSSNDRPRAPGRRGPGRFLLMVVRARGRLADSAGGGAGAPRRPRRAGRRDPRPADGRVHRLGLVRGRTAWATPGPGAPLPRAVAVLHLVDARVGCSASPRRSRSRSRTCFGASTGHRAARGPGRQRPSAPRLSLHQRPRIRRRDVEIEGLPEAFDGYRIVQISDLHCGPFASGRRVARWVDSANRLEPDLVAVTGDLIASGSTFIDVVARALGGLRARDGAFAAMGNHDYFGDGEAMVTALEAAGLTVLRNRGVELRRGRPARSTWRASTTPGRGGTICRARWRRARPACPRCCSPTIPCCFPRPPSAASIWCCPATRTAVRWRCRCSRAS